MSSMNYSDRDSLGRKKLPSLNDIGAMSHARKLAHSAITPEAECRLSEPQSFFTIYKNNSCCELDQLVNCIDQFLAEHHLDDEF